jgi:hypothetical protein
LIDQFGRVSCEDLFARADGFVYELGNRRNSTGYAIIYGEKNRLFRNLIPEQSLLGSMLWRKLERDRLIILRGEERDTIEVEFWLVPAGAEKPPLKEAAWDLTFPPGSKPFLFDSNGEDIICPTPYLRVELFSEFLNANLGSKGNVVITAASSGAIRREKAKLLERLKANNIQLNRLRFFERKDSSYPRIELWLVPKRKRS